ncbi:phosphatase PAP2 family protein [Vibrio splendidus]|uniref:phosphatase PAP2 family protein n=1 Tax=Vibrio splendidus TaxID=29497 RepID=UPI00352C579B
MKGYMDSETTSAKPVPQKESSNLLSSLLNEFRRNKLILYYVAFSTLFTFIVNLFVPHEIDYNIYSYLELWAMLCYTTFVFWATFYYCFLLVKRERQPAKRFLKKIRALFFPVSKPLCFVILMLALNVSLSNYTFFKSLLPFLNPFILDINFYYVDKWLHFGVIPWEITHAVLPNAMSSLVINILYNLWFFINWGMLLYFILYRKNDLLRSQFLLTYLISWFLIGNVVATLLSSAGPAFFHHIEAQDLYLQLMQRLELQSSELTNIGLIPIWALSTQDMLWENHINIIGSVGSGISAMPSLHVVIAVLTAMTLFKLNRTLGYIAWVYAFFIQVGSVHLAWHYAIDGYVGALLVITLWHLIGYLLRRNSPPITQQQ